VARLGSGAPFPTTGRGLVLVSESRGGGRFAPLAIPGQCPGSAGRRAQWYSRGPCAPAPPEISCQARAGTAWGAQETRVLLAGGGFGRP
jgi:hypothetical protein